MPAMIHLYVDDCDATYERALAAGGTSVREPEDQFYGDRNAGVRDSAGNLLVDRDARRGRDRGARSRSAWRGDAPRRRAEG